MKSITSFTKNIVFAIFLVAWFVLLLKINNSFSFHDLNIKFFKCIKFKVYFMFLSTLFIAYLTVALYLLVSPSVHNIVGISVDSC